MTAKQQRRRSPRKPKPEDSLDHTNVVQPPEPPKIDWDNYEGEVAVVTMVVPADMVGEIVGPEGTIKHTERCPVEELLDFDDASARFAIIRNAITKGTRVVAGLPPNQPVAVPEPVREPAHAPQARVQQQAPQAANVKAEAQYGQGPEADAPTGNKALLVVYCDEGALDQVSSIVPNDALFWCETIPEATMMDKSRHGMIGEKFLTSIWRAMKVGPS